METDPSIVDITTSLGFLFLHTISEPPQVILQPIVDVILVDDTKVTQSIIGEIEYLEFTILCPHKIVCHDCNETLVVLAHAIQNVLLHKLIELVCLIEYEVDRFHFFFALSGKRTHSILPSSFLRRKSFLVRFSFIHSLYMFPSMV